MYMTLDGYLGELRRLVPTLTPSDVRWDGPPIRIIDVRPADAFQRSHIPNAEHIARERLEFDLWRSAAADVRMLFVCQSGVRSLLAAKTAQDMGFRHVMSLDGGMDAWHASGLTTESARSRPVNPERYARHLALPEIGLRGQGRLAEAHVLVVGAGGLGSPAALYLAAAGVGRLTIMDDDEVERSNLQRQILHQDERVGWPKVASAAATLRALNPEVDVVPLAQRFDHESLDVVNGCQAVLDGTDNFSSRYLLNQACVQAGVPYVYGSVHGMEGEVAAFGVGREKACYACLHPKPPPKGMAPNCAQLGVLGAIPGVIGVLQAIEVLKIILRLSPDQGTRLIHYDAHASRFIRAAVPQSPHCEVCRSS
ncbi:MAG: ThiF family adenylyltransferase [Myxococcota bacterium]|nr:ThiF family adenylyltransferase [Myxococcota bacterium]